MKKAISVLLSTAMLTASLSPTAAAVDLKLLSNPDVITAMAEETGAAAADAVPDAGSLPALELGTPLSLTFEPLTGDAQETGFAAATFTPEESGCYEFVCDTPYSGLEPPAPDPSDPEGSFNIAYSMAVLLSESEDGTDMPGFGIGIDYATIPADVLAEFTEEELLHLSDVCFTSDLEQGKTYTYVFYNFASSAYTTNLTVSPHEHHYSEKTDTSTAYVSDGFTSSGGIYRMCTTWFCGNSEFLETFPAVDECYLETEQYVYDGKAKKPAVVVKTAQDDVRQDLDTQYYSVKYKNNKKVGKATVTISFKDHYEGSLTRTFTIAPKGTSLSKAKAKKKSVALSWKKQATETSGYQIQYSLKKDFKDAASVNVSANKTTSKTIKKLKSGKNYYFRIRTYKSVSGKKYYSAWSGAKSVKVK